VGWSEWLWLAAGLALLVIGAEFLVRGASHLAARLGVAPLVIGLTVVAFGTSAPEMGVSAVSALQGQAGIALGNVIGSNIFNVLFILGLSAVLAPLAVAAQIVRLEVPIMIGVSLVLWSMALDGMLALWESSVLFAGILLYVRLQVNIARAEKTPAVKQEFAGEFDLKVFAKHHWAVDAGAILTGLTLLVLGSRWLVHSAVDIAAAFGISETVIGLTIVAAGTSLPELATSVLASLRGERDIAIGNVIGSNIFNILAVLGVSGMLQPSGLPVEASLLNFDLPVMAAVAVACLPLFLDQRLGRIKGALFLLAYAGYVAYQVLAATGSARLPGFRETMAATVLPLTALTLFGIAAQSARSARR
jgi:cation:H+ antiporter